MKPGYGKIRTVFLNYKLDDYLMEKCQSEHKSISSYIRSLIENEFKNEKE